MSGPASQSSSVSDLLTRQFYQWEVRGRGWTVWNAPVDLEPPFRSFEGHFVPAGFYGDDGVQETTLSRFASRFFRKLGAQQPEQVAPETSEEVEEPEPAYLGSREALVELQ